MKERFAPLPPLGAAVAALLLAALTAPARAQELLTNGNFETGDLSGWQRFVRIDALGTPAPADAGGFTPSTPGSDTPAIGFSPGFSTAPNPVGGAFYAVSVTDLPSAHALLQDFIVPLGSASLSLSFQMFVNDQSGLGAIIDPAGLDPTTGGAFADNQHARVDLLRAGASPFSTDSADVLASLYLGVDDPAGVPNPYTAYSFDLTGVALPGNAYRLRFADVGNLSPVHVGVDNVSILSARGVTSTAVPESGTAALLCAALAAGGVGVMRRRRRPAS